MKKHFFLAIVSLTFLPLLGNAQVILHPAKPLTKKPVTATPLNTNTAHPLTFIKNNIDQGKACYNMYVSVCFVEKHEAKYKPGPILAYALSGVKSESNYIKSDFGLVRSDKHFSQAYKNTCEVILRPTSTGGFDPNNVKLTWRFPDIGLKTFMLENVHVQVSAYGVTISGDATVDGQKFLAVSIAIGETSCLI
ncbi:hypothetical protein A9P82_14335 [Arachidicoccus ginsenosidimutans]|uniref:hypothetical protein n=1 Tax=Arachidicoccus sp. BS20 TaxID=1850526 RepID=UPI0007F08294|nr:hypothetical protein [Arachidicoccus sp. BS20]ANI90364.1 hypothetical protein A9P82_14335 [Arachidicoccus sp. BS20]